jgi:septal ring factor EnvC (AmiA/AmiB activator)
MSAAAERHGAELNSLRRELAAAHVSRDAAISEATGLQAELSRVGAELAVTRERVSSESSDLGEANRLLADAKALADRLQAQREGR